MSQGYINLVLQDTPVAYYALDETATAKDLSGSGYHLTYVGSTQGTGVLGSAEKTAEFTTQSQYVSRTATMGLLPFGSSARTLECWSYPYNVNPGGNLISYGPSGGGAQSFILATNVVSGPTYLFTDGVNGSNNITVSGAQIQTANQWNHIVFTMTSGGAWTYYLNGASASSGTFPTGINTGSSSSALTIAARTDQGPGPNNAIWPGRIGHVAIYSSVLSAGRISAHYQSMSRSGVTY